jgi:uncharacterized protein
VNHPLSHAASLFSRLFSNPKDTSRRFWYRFGMRKKTIVTRRDFLQFMGQGALALSLAGSTGQLLQACSRISTDPGEKILPEHPFLSLAPSSEDSLRLAGGMRQRIIAAWGDELGPGLRFGFNNDFLAFFPLDEQKNEGLLCVNFEYPHSLFVAGFDGTGEKTRAQTEKEMDCTGMGVVHIREGKRGHWTVVKGSSHNRLVTGRTRIPLASARPIEGSRVALGTLGNCAGGVTPWGNYLTCEENYQLFYGETVHGPKGKKSHKSSGVFEWFKHYPQPPEHYGWVVEVNPRTGSAKKLTALGRFAHESATVAVAADGRPVVYSGDDAPDQFLYKFISDTKTSLEKGTLYAADLEKGRWLPLSRKLSPVLRRNFKDETEVLIRAREAARLLGATPLDRPEDIDICPRTGAVYVALTGNRRKGNLYGSILKVEEKAGDYHSLEFDSSTFITGGTKSGIACPDNMAFDPKGNLWITTDMSGSAMNKPPYSAFKNNGLFFVPMEGENAGRAYLVATGPTDSELTGPCFSPDGRTLFLSVQHPGEQTKSLDQLTSHWPEGGKSAPKPAVVAISGGLLDTIMRA